MAEHIKPSANVVDLTEQLRRRRRRDQEGAVLDLVELNFDEFKVEVCLMLDEVRHNIRSLENLCFTLALLVRGEFIDDEAKLGLAQALHQL